MITLNEMEARIYRLVYEGKNLTEICKIIGKKRNFITYNLYSLQKLKMVVKKREGKRHIYIPSNLEYTEVHERPHTGLATAKMAYKSTLTDAQRLELINHYKQMSRIELVKKLGIPKLQLNFEIEKLRQEGYIKGVS